MWLFLLTPIFALFASCPVEDFLSQSLLFQADELTKKYHFEIAKLSRPIETPQAKKALQQASIWFSIDLETLQNPSFLSLSSEPFWELLREIGVEGVRLQNVKAGGKYRTSLGLDAKWGQGWEELMAILQKKGIILIIDSIGEATGLSADFFLALKNWGDYPSLYHLIEIEKADWKLLPEVPPCQLATNIPWLELQRLHKKGYVPEDFSPYEKRSQWNVTPPTKGADGQVRRWIYLKSRALDPVIDWLNPSFAGCRIGAADTLESIYNLGAGIIQWNELSGMNAGKTLALWTRKLGAFSAMDVTGGLYAMKEAPADLIHDRLTRQALMHALLTEDAEALRLMYRLMLKEDMEAKRLIHSLQPFQEFGCEWTEFTAQPQKRVPYYEETLTQEALKFRLLKEDIESLKGNNVPTWPSLCVQSSQGGDFLEAQKIHLLLSFFYAMQPGVFSFSASDLMGALTQEPLDLFSGNKASLYGSLESQMRNSCSFASRLRHMFSIRNDFGIAFGRLAAIPHTAHLNLLAIVYQLDGGRTELLTINFSKQKIHETFEIPSIRQTYAIDLMTGLGEQKPVSSPNITVTLPPLSGKVILFQPKYYD